MADDLSSLLGGLLNIQQQPQVNSGLLGGLNQALSPYGGQMGLGLSLLANSNTPGGFGSILGRSALEAQQQQMQNQQQRIALAQAGVGLGSSLQQLRAAQQYFNPGQQAQAAVAGDGAPPPSAGGVAPLQGQPMPQGQGQGVPGGAGQAQGMPGGGGMPQGQRQASGGIDIDNIPIGGKTPDQIRAYDGIFLKKDPAVTNKEIRDQQMQIAQQMVRPQLAQLDTIVKSDKPAQYVRANAQLSAAFAQLAPGMGINPNSGLTDANVRAVFGMKRNQLAGSVGLGEEAPIVPLKTVQTGLGGSYQINPVDGKISGGAPQQETGQFIMGDGTVRMMTKAEGIAKGLTPFNPSIYGAANLSDQAIQMQADMVRANGGKLTPGMARNPIMAAKIMDRVAKDADATGDSATAIIARGQALKANGQALDQVSKREAYITTATTKLDMDLNNLLQVANRVDSTGSPIINRALRAYQQGVAGDKDVAQMVTWLNAVEGEYAKINSGGTGGAAPSVAVRKDAQEVINKNFSAGGMAAVAQAMRGDGQNARAALAQEKAAIMQGISTPPPATDSAAPQASSAGLGLNQSVKVGQFTVTRVK